MPKTDQLRMFLLVAECKDFSAAARVLDKNPSVISRSMALLEDVLGFRLFERSTRSVTLTPQGVRYYGVCRTLLVNLDETARFLRDESRGKVLTLQISPSLQEYFLPALSEFCREFPECRFVINAHEQPSTALCVVEHMPESRWPVLPLGDIHWVYVAAFAYLQSAGRLTGFNDLATHCLLLTEQQAQNGVVVRQAGAQRYWQSQNKHVLTDFSAVLAAVKLGMGIGFLPRFYVQAALRGGDIMQVLDEVNVVGSSIYCLSNPALEQVDMMLPLLREKLQVFHQAQLKKGGL
jgi:DNA-binding transcriptional LysR family regulator